MCRWRYLSMLVLMFVMVVPVLALQFSRQRPGPDSIAIEDKWERQRQRDRNEERQKELKEQTAKLLELATELKQHVEKTDENTLSLNVIRKAEEIEKLAKKVREKMKADYLMPGPAASPSIVR